MKKILIALAAVASLGSVSAQVINLPANGGSITTEQCAVLGETVAISTSANVSFVANCSEGENAVNIAACHASGSRNNSIACSITVPEGPGGTPAAEYNHPSCNAGNAGTTITLATPEYRGFRASTRGGSVAAQTLTGNCTDATLAPLVAF